MRGRAELSGNLEVEPHLACAIMRLAAAPNQLPEDRDSFCHSVLFARNFDFAPAGEDAEQWKLKISCRPPNDGKMRQSGDMRPDKPTGNGKSEM